MDIDYRKVQEIVGNHQRFSLALEEPENFYIWTDKDFTEDMIDEVVIDFYFEKLKYAVEHADSLIKQFFQYKFYGFYGVDTRLVKSPEEMCLGLSFETFVLAPGAKELGAGFSNDKFMFGHMISVGWDYDWTILDIYIS